jgi:hypothetical protein
MQENQDTVLYYVIIELATYCVDRRTPMDLPKPGKNKGCYKSLNTHFIASQKKLPAEA